MTEEVPAIRVSNLALSYPGQGRQGRVEALRGISFDVRDGQFVSVLGPSGCGKSTLLKVIADLLPPTEGSVHIYGGEARAARQSRKVGFVFQTPVLFPWRTAEQNVSLVLELMGVGRRVRADRARELLSMVGLERFADHHPSQLSGGMQQRVSIARALSYDPSILLMDEPFGALDAITRDNMGFELLNIWRRTRKTIVFVTHSITEAVLLSDIVITMTAAPGRVRAIRRINLSRPRDQETRLSTEFVNYTRDLLSDLSEPIRVG